MPTSSTLTVFICGSGNNLSKDKSSEQAVPKLAELCVGHHFALDGIGGNKDETKRYIMAPSGFFMLDHGRKIENPLAQNSFEKSGKDAGSGWGVNKIILNAMEYIYDRVKRTSYEGIQRINLIGFSRGAVCCTQLAWLIHGYFASSRMRIPAINIFLFDPVAGGINGFKGHMSFRGLTYRTDRTQLPPSVRDFQGIVQSFLDNNHLSAHGWGFNSNMPRPTNADTQYKVQVMPGGHNASSKFNIDRGGTPLGLIGLTMAQDFLMRNHTKFSTDVRLSPMEMAEAYGQVRYENDFQKKGGQKADITFFQQGRFVRSAQRRHAVNRFRQISDHPFWVNLHHKELLYAVDQELAYEIERLKLKGWNSINRRTWMRLKITRRLPHTATALEQMGFTPDD